jgi:transcriptional regulator with XRE-family HTH domain
MPPLPKKPYSPSLRTDRNTVGKTVRRLRKAQQLTRDELAARAQVKGWNISPFVLRRIEYGEREVTDIELRKLAKALRVRPAVLLE